MDRKAALKLCVLLALALVAAAGLAGYGRQLREDMAHHRIMEAPEDRRALTEELQIGDIRQRLLAEDSDSAPAPAPGSDSAEAPVSASYGSSAPEDSSSSSSSSSGGSASLGGIAGRRLLQ